MTPSTANTVRTTHRKKVGILGCGAIGSRIAKAVHNELNQFCDLVGLYDITVPKMERIAQDLKVANLSKHTFAELLASCDVIVEAINTDDALSLIRQALSAQKHVLALSVGRLLNAADIFDLARTNNCTLMIPSGAIAGIDAIKSASLVNIDQISLTTRKPISGFQNNAYIKERGINLSAIRGEMTVFEGDVDTALKYFPQNINVAATLALASGAKSKITIRIVTSPDFTDNSHEIELVGDCGRMISRTENVICPDNPKTSYLAVLSGIQTLKDFCSGIRIGT